MLKHIFSLFFLAMVSVVIRNMVSSCGDFQSQPGLDYDGNNIPNSYETVNNYEECCNKCDLTSGCNAFVYDAPNGCYKKTGKSTPSSKASATSGFRRSTCPDFKREDNIEYDGNNLPGSPVSSITNYGECCSRCYTTTGCIAFSYDPTTQQCYLKNARGTRIANSAFQSGYNATCADYQREDGVDYNDHDLSSPNNFAGTNDYDSCCRSCTLTPGCNAFTFLAGQGCYKKSERFGPSNSGGRISGYKLTPVQWDTFQKDVCGSICTRQYSAVLLNIPQGGDPVALCGTTPAAIRGTSFTGATRCGASGTTAKGEFDVHDSTCCPPD